MVLSTGLIIVGVAILLIPPLLQRFHVDVRGGEVIVGILLALFLPNVLHTDWFTFIAELGLLILMFEIGLDIDLDRLREDPWPSLKYGFVSFLVPFIASGVASYFLIGDVLSSFIIAIGLSSTALAVVIPTMRRQGISSDLVKNAAMVSEMIGITLLMAFVRGQSLGSTSFFLEAGSIIFFVVFTVFLIPRFLNHMQFLENKTFIQFETKFMLFVLLIVALVSEELGVHAATGAFLAGLFLSESTHQGLEIEERLRPIIELLVPVFFVHIGYLVKPSLLTLEAFLVAILLAAVVYFSRLIMFQSLSNWLSSSPDLRLVTLFAPCMTITATAAEIGTTTGVFSSTVFTTFLLAGLVLTIVGPLGVQAQRFFEG